MKVGGAILLVLYGLLTFSRWEPTTDDERGRVPAEARRGPGGAWLWYGGYRGGK